MEIPSKGENDQEKIKKEKVLEMLRTNGPDHPETRELVMRWTVQREIEVRKENTSRATIIFNIERSDLYIAGGDKNGAIECLEDALTQAVHENEKGLEKQIMKKLKSLK